MPNTVSKLNTAILCIILAAGCATLPLPEDRAASAEKIASSNGFEKIFIKAGPFTLTSYYKFKDPNSPLRIYIEGDGVAWISRTKLSDDPTPRKALVLELATLDQASNVAYLARPGQYVGPKAALCDSSYWSSKRFSEEVIGSMNEAITELRRKANSNKIDLVGYSGGAAVAVLITSRRDDVTSLRTIAGNLDPTSLNSYHHVDPLKGSLDPMDVAGKLKDLPQRHFVGAKDSIVPPFIARSFLKRAGLGYSERITIVEDTTHTKGWEGCWRKLLSLPLIGSD